MKRFGFILIPLLAAALSSCTKDDPFADGNRVVLDGTTSVFTHSAIYYDSASDGYDLVLSQHEIDLDSQSYHAPDGIIVGLDFPGEMSSGTFDLTKDCSTVNWLFYFNYWKDGHCDLREINYQKISSGTLEINMSSSKVKIILKAETIDGHTIALYYRGTPKKVDKYIGVWD